VHEAKESIEEVVDVAKGARLLPLPVDGDRLVIQRLHDEVGHHTPVIRMHARAISIENACDFYVQIVLAKIVEEQSLCAALALVVAGTWTNWIYVTPILLRLRVNTGIAIHF